MSAEQPGYIPHDQLNWELELLSHLCKKLSAVLLDPFPNTIPIRIEQISLKDHTLRFSWSFQQHDSEVRKVGRVADLREYRKGFANIAASELAGIIVDENLFPVESGAGRSAGEDGVIWIGG